MVQGTLRLDLIELPAQCSFISHEYTSGAAASASVVLARLAVPPSPTPANLDWDGNQHSALIIWRHPSPKEHDTYDDLKNDVIKEGAYAVAFAAVHASDEYVVRKRAYHGSGADWYLVRKGDPDESFIKLEVSGMTTDRSPSTRLNAKVTQVSRGDLSSPALAVVVGFHRLKISIRRR